MYDYVKVVLPESYDLVVGDTFHLFYRGIIEEESPESVNYQKLYFKKGGQCSFYCRFP